MGKTAVCMVAALLLLGNVAKGQSVTVRGYFLEDSVLLGSPATYILVAEYPGSMQVLFPDSTFSFTPFEFSAKSYSPSAMINGSIVDSVAYELITFELDPYQGLSMPVFQIRQRGDSLQVYASPDSIRIAGLIEEMPKDAQLKETVEYNPLNFAFNYPYLVLGSIIFVIIALTVFLVFGKTIRRKIRLYRMRKRYEQFSNSFSDFVRKLREHPELPVAEAAFVSWKSYLESLEGIPYTKLTTREILKGEENETLKTALKNIDRCIYGRVADKEIAKQFEMLEDISADKYLKKKVEVANG